MATYQHNPRHDLRVPYSFFMTPIATQVMYRIIKAHVDKYARVDLKYQSIGYSAWDDSTHSYVKCIMSSAEAQRVFLELYPEKIVGKECDIIITDDLESFPYDDCDITDD